MQWVCEICGYVHDDDDLPDVCPVCGAPKSKFTESSGKGSGLLLDELETDHDDDFTNDLYSGFDE
ncbi:MAG: hypothetical protein KAU36_01735 [candidate division Zixibacteria bacterium]|nr:hypothetical protein [candidate division Zixibacteria bacterium]